MNIKRFTNGLLAALLLMGLFAVTSCEEDEPTPSITCDDLAVTVVMDTTAVGPDSLFVLTLTAIVDGGTEPYVYEWSTGETTSSIEMTENGNYTVTVTDAGGCTEEGSFELAGPDPCDSFTAWIYTDSSAVNTLLTATPSSGTAPYTYVWSNGATTNSIEITEYGTYTVDITDANGCTTSASYEYVYTDPCLDFMVEVGVAQDSTGTGGNNNLLYPSTSGGVGPYAYNWSTGETTYTIIPSGAGNYSVTVTDNNGCVAEDDIDY